MCDNARLFCLHIRTVPSRHLAEWISPRPVGVCRTWLYAEEGLQSRRKDELQDVGSTAAVAVFPASNRRDSRQQHHRRGELLSVMARRFTEMGLEGGVRLRAGRPMGLGSITESNKRYFRSSKALQSALRPTGCWNVFSLRYDGRTVNLHVVPRLRMSGTVTLFPLYAFMTWTGTTLPVPLLLSVVRERLK
jgi:hypothetical protein